MPIINKILCVTLFDNKKNKLLIFKHKLKCSTICMLMNKSKENAKLFLFRKTVELYFIV